MFPDPHCEFLYYPRLSHSRQGNMDIWAKMPSAATGSKLKQATLGTKQSPNTKHALANTTPTALDEEMGTQTGRETSPRFHQVAATLENFNRKKSVPGNANQSSKEQLKHTLLLRVAPSSITISSQQGCTCMWTTSQHKCQLPGYDLSTQDHTRTGLCPPSLSHICSSHSACLQSCPSKPSSWLALALTTGILLPVSTASSHTPN